MSTDGNSGFTYWKRPWGKWFVLTAAILQLFLLWMNLQEYNRLSVSGIFSASELAAFAARKNFLCSTNGISAGCFFGIFFIGMFARSQRAARLLEGALLLLLALVWGVVGMTLHLFSFQGRGLFCSAILLLALCGSIHNFLKYRKK